MPAIDNRSGVLQHNKDRASPGYTLFTPIGMFTTYLIDMDGNVVHEWKLPNELGHYAYLLENGNLLASVKTDDGPKGLPAKGGHLIEYDWDGNIVWEYIDDFQHHDFRRQKDGNTVYVAWELLDDEIRDKVPGGLLGREHEDGIYGDVIREIDPNGNLVCE